MGVHGRMLSDTHAEPATCATGVALGRSGRAYRAIAIGADAAVEGEAAVYALRMDNLWGWVGAAADLIDNPDSRARFRALSAAGASLFRLDVTADARERMAIAWDLENAPIASRRCAA